MDQLLPFYILITLVFSALFSGMEIAFVSANRLKIELEKKEGHLSSKVLANFYESPSKFISAMLVGNNIALVIYGILMARLLDPYLYQILSNDWSVLLVQTILSTLVVLVTAEFLPKAIFRINPNQTLAFFALPVYGIYKCLTPIVWTAERINNGIFKLFLKSEVSDEENTFSRVDLDHYLKEVQDNSTDIEHIENEVQILQNALDFSKLKARECMIPRIEIVALEEDKSIDELRDLFFRTGLSKILIYRETIDDIIGYVHSFEMFKKPNSLKEILLPVSVIPETMPANEIMELLIKQKKSIVVVVDEFGGTAGILTLEDIVEQIFGDIEDEHDRENLVEKQISEHVYEFSARLEIDYINDIFNLNLPENESYETLAGLIINEYEDIPEEGEEIQVDNFTFHILKVEDNRIDRVRLSVNTTD